MAKSRNAYITADEIGGKIVIRVFKKTTFDKIKEVLSELALPAPSDSKYVKDSICLPILNDDGEPIAYMYIDYYCPA